MVKPITTAETTGGVVLLEETRARWTGQQCEVVAVGKEEMCEDEDCERQHDYAVKCGDVGYGPPFHSCSISEGDWLLVRPRCFVLTDEENVWVCKQSDVLAKLTLA